jgi:hypothetical protein
MTASGGSGGKRVALVIGNSAYANVESLRNASNDAEAIAESLKLAGFGEIAKHKNVGFDAMRLAVQAFDHSVQGADMAVLYYAGHGIEVDGENYLIPVDANLKFDHDVAFETMSLSQILRCVGGARQLRLVILDACLENSFTARMIRSSRTQTIGRGLAEVKPGGNVLVAYAAKGGTVALEGSGVNSPFAAALLDYLTKPGIEIGFLFRYVRDAVLKATDHKQEPILYGSLGGDPIYLVPPTAEPTVERPKSGPDVFISYASTDRPIAESIAQDLTRDGYTVWWDTKLVGGEQFRKAIVAELDAARAALVIWTRASIESDWVYDEASRARLSGKLIPLRVAELDPKNIPPPFGSLHTLPHGDRASLKAALSRFNVLPRAAGAGASGERHAGPVDDRTLENNYWVAIQHSTDPSDFESFLAKKFAEGIFTQIARRKLEDLLRAASESEVLERFLREHPGSEHVQLARDLWVVLEWKRIEGCNDAGKLRAFLDRFGTSEFAKPAVAVLAKMEWRRIRSSRDKRDIERFIAEFGGAAEAAEARRRLAGVTKGTTLSTVSSFKWLVIGLSLAVMALLGYALLSGGTEDARVRSNADWQRSGQHQQSEVKLEAQTKTPPEVAKADVEPRAITLGEIFRDCPNCPELVVIPAGTFDMGSPKGEIGRDENEDFVKVTIANPIAVGRFAVTRGEFSVFVKSANHRMEGGCATWTGADFEMRSDRSWRFPGYEQDDRHPVTCVSWDDAKAYVGWLSKTTGKPYRLLCNYSPPAAL